MDIAERQYLHGCGSDIDYSILILKRPFDMEKLPTGHGDTIPFIELRINDRIGDASLILQAQKDEPFRCARTLTSNHRPGDARIGAVPP